MRTSTLLLAAAVAVLLVLPRCSSKPSVSVKSEKSQQQAASAAQSSSSEEEEIKQNSCAGEYSKKSKKSSNKAVSASSSSSKESYEAKSVGGQSCSSKRELSDEEIKNYYCRKEGETDIEYFKRIVTRNSYTSTTESYVKVLNIVRKHYPHLPLWYDLKCKDIVKSYYFVMYTKQSHESEEMYFKRLITKESWETTDIAFKRINVLRAIFPKISLWTDEKYFEGYTKELYLYLYQKRETESEEDYAKRLLEKDSYCDINDEYWARRLHLIQLTYSSSSIWYKEKYFKKWTSSYYKIWFNMGKATNAERLTAVLKPFHGESEENAIKRCRLIRKATSSCGFWDAKYFEEVQKSRTLDSKYLCKVQEQLFSECSSSYKKKSSRKSASASSSASSSEQSTVIKKN